MHDPVAVGRILGEYRERLEGCFDELLPLVTRCDQLNELKARGDTLAVVAPLTGGTEHIIQGIFEKLSGHGFLLLAPHPVMNSLPAALETFSALRGAGRAWIIVEWPPSSGIRRFVRALRAVQEIRCTRIGLIGEPSPWLVYSSGVAVEDGLKEVFKGVSLVKIDLEELYRKIERIKDDSLRRVADEVVGRAQSIHVPRSEIENP